MFKGFLGTHVLTSLPKENLHASLHTWEFILVHFLFQYKEHFMDEFLFCFSFNHSFRFI